MRTLTWQTMWNAVGRVLPFRGGLRRRILFWFLVLSLLPLFLSNTVGYLVTRRIIENQVRSYLGALTEAEAQHVATEIERQKLYLGVVATGDQFLSANVPAAAAAVGRRDQDEQVTAMLYSHLERKLAELDPLSELFVMDTGGRVVAATRRGRVGTSWGGTELLRLGQVGPVFAQDWDAQRGQPEPLCLLATPIRGPDGSLVGVLAGSFGMDQLQRLLQTPAHLAQDVHAYIVDTTGRPLLFSRSLEVPSYAQPLVSQPVGSIARYVNHEGAAVLGTAVAIPGLPWHYLAEVPLASAFGDLRRLAVLAAALEAAFALTLVGIVWIVARSIVAPLRRLVAAAERIHEGELGVQVGIDRADELGELGRTFDQMSSELQMSARRIQELHDHEMRRAAQLASVGELASGIAHEIKNPLAGLASGINLLARRVGDDAEAAGILREIRSQHDRIQFAIRDLLSYAQPKEPRLAWTDPGHLVNRVVPLVRAQADAAAVRIEHPTVDGLPPIHVDRELMTQALVNLTLNGIQAMRPGGVLRISLRHENDDVEIAISDTGSGIPADQLEVIFRPFYTTKHAGTGLGLAITRGIVERHGGRLEVASEFGKGSTFTIVLPATLPEGKRR